MKFRPWCFIYPVIYFPFSTQTTMDRKTPPRAAPLSENSSLGRWSFAPVLAGENTPDIYNGGNLVAISVAEIDSDFYLKFGYFSDTTGGTVTLHCFQAWPLCVSYQF